MGIGRPINICFGHCRNVPLPNICDDAVNDFHDYLIGYGVIESIWDSAPNGYGVRRDGVLVNPDEYVFFDGSQATPYNGYAFIRFAVIQTDFAGRYYDITADVYGLEMGGASAERNFAKIIGNIISNTTWGLGGSVSAASITTAAAALDTITNMYCDGAITRQVVARDIIDELLFTCRGTLEKGNDAEWDLIIDGTKASEGNFGDNDAYYDNCEVLSVSCVPVGEALKSATVHYDLQSGNPYKMVIDVHTTFGVDRVYELNFVIETNTAKKVLSYLYNRSIYSDTKVILRTDLEGKNLRRGDVLTLTVPARGIAAQDYVIDKIRRGFTNFQFECREYSASIFNNEVIDAPDAKDEKLIGTAGPQSWVTSEFPIEAMETSVFSHVLPVRVDGTVYRFPANMAGGQIGTTGGWRLCVAEASAAIEIANSVIDLNIPVCSKIEGVQFRVDVALTAGETWNAYYNDGGDIQEIAHEEAVAVNTKINVPFNCLDTAGTLALVAHANIIVPVTDAVTDIIIRRHSNPGVDAFTQGGTIRAIVYYWAFTQMNDA